ncbi:uncharacterized protein LOC123527264 isoform X2 [Mercenaria mercenaria]|nr:uncharacterized protein LOC123527264 isoform X2 [Mercenaria mercenaria]
MPFLENLTDIYYDIEDTEEMEEPESVRHVAMGMLGFLSISGIIGNALVLYVFTRQKQKLSSTIFILTLAGTDLITSLVTMPYTIVMELLHYTVDHDAVCKVFQLLTTTTIPFSASVMVAIAVDRYLCIVHPFKHTMTIKRAKITVVLLAIFSTCLGLPSSLMYGVNKREIYTPAYLNDVLRMHNISGHQQAILFESSTKNSIAYYDEETSELNRTLRSLFSNDTVTQTYTYIHNTGKCHKNGLIVDMSFFNVYQKVYSSYFAVCAVIVIVLYFIIYRSVLTRRRRRFHLTTSCCVFLSPGQNVENNEHEQTEFTMLNNKDKSPSNTSNKKFNEESFKNEPKGQDDKNGNTAEKQDANADKESLMRPSGVSRAKMEKLRMANIKTALMLSIVALTYIIAFLPAWLMALRIIPMNSIVFFMYFTYNVANPIIYAFLNQSFRNHLQTLFKCKQ